MQRLAKFALVIGLVCLLVAAAPGTPSFVLGVVGGSLSLLALLRRLAPAVPIILMTAFPTPEVVAEARRLGAFAVVEKPFDLNGLVPLVRRALASAPPR